MDNQNMNQQMAPQPADGQQSFSQEKVGLGELWKRSMIGNYTNFSGRATRREYWFVYLLNNAFSFCLQIVGSIILAIAGSDTGSALAAIPMIGAVIFALAFIIPGIALGVRRLHDINRSGWWFFINIIPIAGWIVFIVFLFTKGDAGSNKYGAPAEYVA